LEDGLLEWLTDTYAALQLWLFEAVVQPLAMAVGAADLLDLAFEGTGWFVLGVLQLLVLGLVIGPLQRWRPVEAVTDRAAIRVDLVYTVIHRLGFFKLLMFFTVENGLEQGIGWLRAHGLETWHLDQWWPGVTDVAWVSFLIYLVAFDFVNYWYHRLSHRFDWWWALHSLHHSQRQMTMWTDNRNHLLDDMIRSAVMVVVAIVIGVGPGQFVALVVFGQLSESFQHANLRVSFGRWGERLWISPRFHRVHHSIGIGHETEGKGSLGGHNFGVLLPWWDMLLGTANFDRGFEATGVRDQVEPDALGRVQDYGRGFWAQQWMGLRRLFRA
jgi:sterol desaturase/sphingolipid hydroxylase (fatty acid hydroxylase superfamily)